MNYAFQFGELSVDQRRGVISLIPKKDRSREFLKNWRPLSLLNVDYKILAKALAMRLQKFLPILINEDQTGYVKGRYIGENIRLISDIIQYYKDRNLSGLLLLVDFEKAFDTIEWSFIDRVLLSFNFGTLFRKWVKIIYCNVHSCVINNGYISEFFPQSRGVRQGCPLLLSYLF